MPVDRYLHAPGCASHRTARAIPDPAVGAKFGAWTVTGAVFRVGKSRRVPVQCACGTRQTARVDNLVAGKTTGCRRCGGWAKRAKLSAAGSLRP